MLILRAAEVEEEASKEIPVGRPSQAEAFEPAHDDRVVALALAAIVDVTARQERATGINSSGSLALGSSLDSPEATVAEWFSLGIAGLAIIVSVLTAIRQQRVQTRMAAIEQARRAEEVAARKEANVTAYFDPKVTSTGKIGRNLVLKNQGLAPAEEVLFEMVPVGDGEAPFLISSEGGRPLPMLDAGGTYECPAVNSKDTAPFIDVILRWKDGAGPKEKTIRLSTLG